METVYGFWSKSRKKWACWITPDDKEYFDDGYKYTHDVDDRRIVKGSLAFLQKTHARLHTRAQRVSISGRQFANLVDLEIRPMPLPPSQNKVTMSNGSTIHFIKPGKFQALRGKCPHLQKNCSCFSHLYSLSSDVDEGSVWTFDALNDADADGVARKYLGINNWKYALLSKHNEDGSISVIREYPEEIS